MAKIGSKLELFERWVKAHCVGREMSSPPADWDRDAEFFYLIDGLQYRVRVNDVPKEFLF
jgi:hypothetical protein